MIILIGGTSFIGVYTVDEFLKQGKKIAVTGRNNKFRSYYESLGVDYYNLDITKPEDFDNLPTQDVEAVILLSALLPANATADLENDENAKDYFEVNTIGTINVLEFCRKNNIKKLLSTTSYADVQNSWTSEYPLTESVPRDYNYSGDHAVYVFSKNAACDVMEYYNQQHGMRNAWFRLPPVYGVGPHGSLFVNGKKVKSGLQIFIEKASSGEDITIYGNPQLTRDVVYVKDVAHAFYCAYNNDHAAGLYNMTSGTPVTLVDQVQTIIDVFSKNHQKTSNILYNSNVTNNTSSYLFSMEKAKNDFNFVPKYSKFKDMMLDYKKDLDNEKHKELFNY
ncbi:NAD-dependent epimerase/dehydratase family protein [Streptococcus zalophi]|uniref:NAD(P)-dependent oxidoreductase n=1 Tax=Streptococcus zalophi TaxID=640031 RepID=A0A934P991_9STRE|nr:NAD(P)-dependent oxidoreductase [Streptococcus zalophi]MBJ8349330.1 NAD(P)-dependent oxidoreductase [Streptococcus zalophi]